MVHRAVSYFLHGTHNFVSNYGMVSVRIMKSYENKLWGVRLGIQRDKKVYRGNTNEICKRISGKSSSCVLSGTITKGNMREIQIWDTTINWKRGF